MQDVWLSVIIPVLNEARRLESGTFLSSLQSPNMEVIIVDGGSTDSSQQLAQKIADKVIRSPKGRAQQMNAGAQAAQGQWLLFLHADSHLPPEGLAQLRSLEHGHDNWGRFDVRLSGKQPIFRIIGFFMNWRSRLSKICTGDQGIFVRRQLFESIGGYADQPLMEDIELSRQLKKLGGFVALSGPITSSSRYWENHGVIRSTLRMWRLRLRYFLGTDAKQLHDIYYQ